MYPSAYEMDEYAGELPDEEYRRSVMRRSSARRSALRRPLPGRSMRRRAAFHRPGLRRSPVARRTGYGRVRRFARPGRSVRAGFRGIPRRGQRRPYPGRWRRRWHRRPWSPRPGIVSYPGTASGSEFMRWVQASLNQVLNLNLPVNGIAGPETRGAIRSFQEQNGLPVDGFVGPDTRRALERALREGPAPAAGPGTGGTSNGAPPAGEPDAAAGEPADMAPPPESGAGSAPAGTPEPDTNAPSAGELEFEVNRRSRAYVRWLQAALNRTLRTSLPVNGYFGRSTRGALMAFQRRHRLRADGWPGPRTEQALVRAGAPRPPGYRSHRGGYGRRPAPSGTPSPALPASLSGLRRRIVQVALQELRRWGNGQVKEDDPRMRSILEAYWRSGAGYMPSGATWWSSVPWSAAFISWVMRQAGAGSSFRYSGGHSYYTVAAKNNRLANNSNPFKAYRISEVSPRLGDLVCKSRSSSGATYDNIREGMATHCDIVVEVQPGKLITVGGNVSNSVKTTPVTIDARGRITQPGYFAVIQTGP